MQIGYKSMSLQKFTEAVELSPQDSAKRAGVDIIINLTTSGGEYEDQKRLQHLAALKPEMCSFDPNTLNWSNSYIFENSPRFLNLLSRGSGKAGRKARVRGVRHRPHRLRHVLRQQAEYPPAPPHPVHHGCGRLHARHRGEPGLPGWTSCPPGATWSVSGIGKAHMPMMLAGLALGCDGLRVGLEDNVLYGKDDRRQQDHRHQ